MKVKICGITKEAEIEYINKYKPEYIGFVIYENSKRYVTVERAMELMRGLEADIKKVAVTVSPDENLINRICEAGFDIIQIHKTLTTAMLEASRIPIWYAVNISNGDKLISSLNILEAFSADYSKQIEAIVVDGAEYGSGNTFEWDNVYPQELKRLVAGKEFVLAGGLRSDNIKTGINIFGPDIVDVSSGVEGLNGKEENLIKDFIERAKEDE